MGLFLRNRDDIDVQDLKTNSRARLLAYTVRYDALLSSCLAQVSVECHVHDCLGIVFNVRFEAK
jgi:hypothetical protein